jgi:hypothetical protein
MLRAHSARIGVVPKGQHLVRRRIRERPYLVASLGLLLLAAVAGGISWWQFGLAGKSRPARAAARRPVAEVPPWTPVATLSQPVPAYASPTAAAPTTTVPTSWAGQFLSMPVIATEPGWDEVRVVARPSDPSTAWVQSAAARMTRTPYHVIVSLRMTRVLLFRRSRLLMCVPAAVGSADTPTPVGHYFVGLFARPPATDGPFIVVTSAVVDEITGWQQSGNPMMTIAEAPSASPVGAGQARTTGGSVELSGTDERRLRPVPLGSPVDVVTVLPHRLDRSDERLCRSKTGLPVVRRRNH